MIPPWLPIVMYIITNAPLLLHKISEIIDALRKKPASEAQAKVEISAAIATGNSQLVADVIADRHAQCIGNACSSSENLRT